MGASGSHRVETLAATGGHPRPQVQRNRRRAEAVGPTGGETARGGCVRGALQTQLDQQLLGTSWRGTGGMSSSRSVRFGANRYAMAGPARKSHEAQQHQCNVSGGVHFMFASVGHSTDTEGACGVMVMVVVIR